MAVKTVKDLEREKKPDETVEEKPKKEELKKTGKQILFVPFAPPGEKTSAVIEIRYTGENDIVLSKIVKLEINDQQYELNRNDFPKGFEDQFILQIFKEGFMSMPSVDPLKPETWKIRHGDFADGQPNNYTGKSYVDLKDGGKIELNWQNGFVLTKDEKIRDILVGKGHYDITTNTVFIQRPDPSRQAITGVGRGAYVQGPTQKQNESKLFKVSDGTFTK